MGTSLDVADRSPNQLPAGFYGVGDDAFVNSNTLLTPWSGTHLTVCQDSFNYHLSAMRQCIERAYFNNLILLMNKENQRNITTCPQESL